MEFRTLKDGRVIPIANPTTVSSPSSFKQPQRPSGYKGYLTETSFTVPNYICRSCGQRVFYYEHPNGAKVLFDSLGPPWPKHPCYQSVGVSNAKRVTSAPKLLQWIPAFWERAITLKSGAIRVQIRTFEHQLRFELSPQQVKSLVVNQGSIKDALFQVAQMSLASNQPEVSIHTGKQPVLAFAQKLKDQRRIDNVEITNQPSMPVEFQVRAVPQKTLKNDKNSPKPVVKVINTRLMLTGITLTIKSENYVLVSAECTGNPITLGMTLEYSENVKVLDILAKNPKVIEVVPVKKLPGFFYVIYKNKKLGRLEKDPDLMKIALMKQPANIGENPFRNPVLTATVLDQLKGQLKMQSSQKK